MISGEIDYTDEEVEEAVDTGPSVDPIPEELNIISKQEVKKIEEVKSISPIKSIQEVVGIYPLTEALAQKLKKLNAKKFRDARR